MIDPPVVFTISRQSVADRKRNVALGALLSLVLAGFTVFGNYRYPQTYNDVLLWSVIGFVLIGNLVNYYRHRRYLRLIADHRVEVHPGHIVFRTGDDESELKIDDIAGLFLYRRRGVLSHLQARLKNDRGIRLEGYQNLEALADAIAGQLPAAHVAERRA